MAEEVAIIRIVGDNSDASLIGGGNNGKSSSSSSGMGNILKGALGALGIGSLVGIVAMIASQFKGLMSVVGNIVKLIGLLLKPIADVVMVLLMPILFMLKPIVILVNQILAPFTRMAMELMREGQVFQAAGLNDLATDAYRTAGSIMLMGLGSIVVEIVSQLIVLVSNVIFDMATEIGAFFLDAIPGVSDSTVQAFRDAMNGARDGVADFIIEQKDLLQNHILDSAITLKEKFLSESASALIAINAKTTAIFDTDSDSITNTMVTKLQELKEKGSSAAKAAVDQILAQMERLRPRQSNFSKYPVKLPVSDSLDTGTSNGYDNPFSDYGYVPQ